MLFDYLLIAYAQIPICRALETFSLSLRFVDDKQASYDDVEERKELEETVKRIFG